MYPFIFPKRCICIFQLSFKPTTLYQCDAIPGLALTCMPSRLAVPSLTNSSGVRAHQYFALEDVLHLGPFMSLHLEFSSWPDLLLFLLEGFDASTGRHWSASSAAHIGRWRSRIKAAPSTTMLHDQFVVSSESRYRYFVSTPSIHWY